MNYNAQTILLVEDDPNDVLLLEKAFKTDGIDLQLRPADGHQSPRQTPHPTLSLSEGGGENRRPTMEYAQASAFKGEEPPFGIESSGCRGKRPRCSRCGSARIESDLTYLYARQKLSNRRCAGCWLVAV